MRGSSNLLLAFACSVAACSKTQPPPGKPVGLEVVCKEPDQSRVQLHGYLRYARGLSNPCSTVAGQRTCTLELHETSQPPEGIGGGANATPTVKLAIRVGDGPAEMYELPNNFDGIGVAVHLQSGANAVDGSHVTVDGVVTTAPAGAGQTDGSKGCFVNVDWVAAG